MTGPYVATQAAVCLTTFVVVMGATNILLGMIRAIR